ncbi:hypothetical protein PIB30_076844 [Stylosanthes scabra]|uniref:Uncharacterized protein n=1 Tax=Stylosanthes scabra TaxID=79078 RepID=A0ABU6YRS6_9FABA|nr:hypothetical protein [Stylosanthes scabra]
MHNAMRARSPIFMKANAVLVAFPAPRAEINEKFNFFFVYLGFLSLIELYVEFEHLSYTAGALGEDPNSQGYNIDSEKEFGTSYEIVGPNVDIYEVDSIAEGDMEDAINALSREDTFWEPCFVFALDLEVMHVPEYPEYMNPTSKDGYFWAFESASWALDIYAAAVIAVPPLSLCRDAASVIVVIPSCLHPCHRVVPDPPGCKTPKASFFNLLFVDFVTSRLIFLLLLTVECGSWDGRILGYSED